jgi:hypothetical protein
MKMNNLKRGQVLTKVGLEVGDQPNKSRVFMWVVRFMKQVPLHSCILDFPIYTTPYDLCTYNKAHVPRSGGLTLPRVIFKQNPVPWAPQRLPLDVHQKW